MEKNTEIDQAFNDLVDVVVVDGDSITTTGYPEEGGGNIATNETVGHFGV